MLRKIESSILGGAVIIGTAQVASRLLGLLRERLLASRFGAGDILDVYYTAFKIPDFIFNMIVLGALSSAFIPVFLELWEKDQAKGAREKESFRVANSLLNVIMIVLLLFGAALFLFTDQIIPWVAFGFPPEKQAMTAELAKIMYLGVLFFGASNIFSGILNAFRKFVAFSLAPIFYNLGIMIGILVLYPRFGVHGLAWGVVLGAFLHFVIQIPSVRKTGFHWSAILDLSLDGVRKIGKLMIPRTLGLGVQQVNQLVITTLASAQVAGSIAVFNLANHLQSFSTNVVGVSLALSAFPVFSQAFSENNTEKFIRHFSETFRRVLFFIIPTSILILLLRAQIVRLVLGAGSFDWDDTILTAQTLGFFSLSLFAQSLIPVFARAFYAFQDTKTPLLVSAAAMICNVILSFWLVARYGVLGLALAFSLSSIIQMMLLFLILRGRIGDFGDDAAIAAVLKILLISLGMGIAVQLLKYVIAPMVNMHSFIGIFLQTTGSIGGGVLVYGFLASLFRLEEVRDIVNLLKKMIHLFGFSWMRNHGS